jgi:hypothetical protein
VRQIGGNFAYLPHNHYQQNTYLPHFATIAYTIRPDPGNPSILLKFCLIFA